MMIVFLFTIFTMKNHFLNAILVVLALLPIGLTFKDSSYIALASSVTPVAITAMWKVNQPLLGSEQDLRPKKHDKDSGAKQA
jgi:hypothetical protein